MIVGYSGETCLIMQSSAAGCTAFRAFICTCTSYSIYLSFIEASCLEWRQPFCSMDDLMSLWLNSGCIHACAKCFRFLSVESRFVASVFAKRISQKRCDVFTWTQPTSTLVNASEKQVKNTQHQKISWFRHLRPMWRIEIALFYLTNSTKATVF